MESALVEIPPIEQFTRLIYKLSYRYFSQMPNKADYSIEDFVQEANLCYLEDQHKFDPERGVAFITFFYNRIRYRFLYFLDECRKHNTSEFFDTLYLEEDASQIAFTDPENIFYKTLSENAKQFVMEFLEPSDEFIVWEKDNPPKSKRISSKRKQIFKFLNVSPNKQKGIVAEMRKKLEEV